MPESKGTPALHLAAEENDISHQMMPSRDKLIKLSTSFDASNMSAIMALKESTCLVSSESLPTMTKNRFTPLRSTPTSLRSVNTLYQGYSTIHLGSNAKWPWRNVNNHHSSLHFILQRTTPREYPQVLYVDTWWKQSLHERQDERRRTDRVSRDQPSIFTCNSVLSLPVRCCRRSKSPLLSFTCSPSRYILPSPCLHHRKTTWIRFASPNYISDSLFRHPPQQSPATKSYG